MSKSKFSTEQRIQAYQEYISGKKSAKQIANELNLGKQGNVRVRTWARMFQAQGKIVLLYPVGFAVSERNDIALTDATLELAHNAYPEATPLYHSDRGFQYTRSVFKTKHETYGMTQSMSRVSRCIDNSPCEGFQGSLKISCLFFILTFNPKKE